MNLQVSDFGTDCYRNAFLGDQILGGSEELEIVVQKSKEALKHWLFPLSSMDSFAGSFISRRVIEEESDSLSMADLAEKMFPKYKELNREEAKEHSAAFLSFFD